MVTYIKMESRLEGFPWNYDSGQACQNHDECVWTNEDVVLLTNMCDWSLCSWDSTERKNKSISSSVPYISYL